MADSTVQTLQNQRSNHGNTTELSRKEIQAAIAKAVELRALHAVLRQGSSPANLRYPPSASPHPHHASHFSALDYPVFTPSYDDEPLPIYQQFHFDNQTLSDCWEECGLVSGNVDDQTILSDYKKANDQSSRNGLSSELISSEPHICPSEDQNSVSERSSGTDFYKPSRTNSLVGEFKSESSCNKCKPAIISTETTENATKNTKNSHTTVVPLLGSHLSSLQPQPKNRAGLINLSWLFPRLKKKHKNETSPNRTQSEEVSQVSGALMSVETLKKELMEANKSRDEALMEVTKTKSSLRDLKQKLEYLETYCEELKKGLRQQTKDSRVFEKLRNLPNRGGESIDGGGEILMPASEEVMVEGFLQVVAEARLSVRQFCKSLVSHIEGSDTNLVEKLNLLLQPFKLSLNSKYSKAVLYHLEAIINQSLFQYYENSV
ncbi:hypothetical protein U1Q18_049636, partial [Sarracenia purpurea var. burkii]